MTPSPHIPTHKHDHAAVDQLETLDFPALQPLVPELLGWMQDFNWPVAKRIAPILSKIGPRITEEIIAVLETDDAAWKYWVLSEVVAHMPADERGRLRECLANLKNQSADDEEWEIESTAREVLARLRAAGDTAG